MEMKNYIFIILFLVVASPFSLAQESDRGDSAISDGYEQIEKMKDESKNEKVEDEQDNNPELLPQGQAASEKVYEMKRRYDKPLYNPEGKRDPFKPFIQAPKEEEVVITEATPPLKKYSLNEFRITGIVWVQNEPKAVVVDPEGNTYFLGKGDEIGNRNGEIIEVRENGLLVKEKRYFEDVFGNRKVEVKKSVLAFVDEGE